MNASSVIEREHVAPLFASAHSALLFAYTFSPNQYGEAGAAERSIAMFGRSRYELPQRPTGRGLSGLDGAGQAGMIKAKVATLPRLMQKVVEARFAILSPRVQHLAMIELALRVREEMPDRNIKLAVRMVQRHYCGEIKLMQLAVEYGLSERSIKRRWAIVRRLLQQFDLQAMSRVELLLEHACVVAAIDD